MARAVASKKEPAVKAVSSSSQLANAESPLAAVRAYLMQKKGKEFSDIRVVLNEETLSASLPHLSTGSDVVDYLIGGEPNSFGVSPCPGWPRGRVSQLWGHESAGKCLTADTLVLTPNGYLTVGEIFEANGLDTGCRSSTSEVSTPLINRHGEVEETTHFTHNGRKVVYKITTRSGTEITSTGNHPHLTMDVNGAWVWKNTRLLAPGDYMIALRGPTLETRSQTPSLKEEEAYFAGVALADGHFAETRLQITNDDPCIKDRIVRHGRDIFGKGALEYDNQSLDGHSINYHFNTKEGVNAFYQRWGWKACRSSEKVLGKVVRTLPKVEMIAFLQGFFDCESHVDPDKVRVEVVSASKVLLQEIKYILSLYGMIASLQPKVVASYPDNNYYRLVLSGEDARTYARVISSRSQQRLQGLTEILNKNHDGGSPNRDGIPHLSRLLRSLYDAVETSRADHHLCADYMGDNPRALLTYDRLAKIVSAFDRCDAPKWILGRLSEILTHRYHYDPIVSVEEMEAQPTFDFALSKTHSFIANGLVTHNTTLCLETAAAVCRAGGTVLYIDWENDIVPDYAAALGVPVTDENRFELLQPDTLEDGIKYAMAYATAGVDLIVFDSVGAAVPRRIAERDAMEVAEQAKVAELQSVWSQELPNLKKVIAKSGTAVVGISQVRANMNTGPGEKSKPQGGNAWKFYSSVRLDLRRVQTETAKEHNVLTHKTDERVVGGIIKVKAVKCKLSRSQGREEVFYIRHGEGIDNVRTMIEIAAAHGILKKSGSWVTWENCPSGALKMQGTEKIRTYFMENESDYEALRAIVMPLLGAGAADAFVEVDEDDDPIKKGNKALDAIFEDHEDGPDLSEPEPEVT